MMEGKKQFRKLLTPFNAVAFFILATAFLLAVSRFTRGLGVMGDHGDTHPWGLFIGFNVLTGVALASGGFVIGTAVHLFGMKEYHSIVRPAILTGFLGYFFVVVALLFDLGRPWRLPYPMVVSFGVTSVLFLVAWHVALYLSTQFVEISPAIFEWLRWKRWRKTAVFVTIGATIFGAILSTLHQSALGALYLLAPAKLHPLWYSPFIPIFFLVSAIVGGLAMAIFVDALSQRFFRSQFELTHEERDRITIGLGKAASITLVTYFFIKVIGLAHGNHWHLLNTPYGYWYLLELLGFVVLPCFLFALGVRDRNVSLVRFTSVVAVLGIILNRINISIIAFNWHLPPAERYIPSWKEVVVSMSIITAGLIVYRWIVNRMPVLHDHPEYRNSH